MSFDVCGPAPDTGQAGQNVQRFGFLDNLRRYLIGFVAHRSIAPKNTSPRHKCALLIAGTHLRDVCPAPELT